MQVVYRYWYTHMQHMYCAVDISFICIQITYILLGKFESGRRKNATRFHSAKVHYQKRIRKAKRKTKHNIEVFS